MALDLLELRPGSSPQRLFQSAAPASIDANAPSQTRSAVRDGLYEIASRLIRRQSIRQPFEPPLRGTPY
jgi:hypothetical protein